MHPGCVAVMQLFIGQLRGAVAGFVQGAPAELCAEELPLSIVVVEAVVMPVAPLVAHLKEVCPLKTQCEMKLGVCCAVGLFP